VGVISSFIVPDLGMEVRRRNFQMSTIPGTRVLFSPKGGISKELLRLIKAAKVNIVVAAYAFSSKYLGNALSEALKRGVKVRIILDGDIARKAYSIDEWLAGEGIEVHFIDVKGGSLHHKFMIIDGKILMTGSYNFTNESEFRNHEAAIFTNNKALIQSFATEFDRIWCLAVLPAPVESTAVPPSPTEVKRLRQGPG
jgi:phosphatidylserine/phosphatidylglycerophosphate/cardiolipin synthase-like enzyme